jgi:hypothetical protein
MKSLSRNTEGEGIRTRHLSFPLENVMGIDTRYWGPSGWQLFHWIAFRVQNPQEVLLMMKDVLPCKFCRQSTTEFVKEMPLEGEAGKWLYDLHNMVNNKLRTQCRDDPAVVNPGPDPSFEDVKHKYETMKINGVLGRDFLFSISANYPEEPTEDDMATQRMFLKKLAEVYPSKAILELHFPVKLESRKTYMKWMYGFLKHVASKTRTEIPSYRGYVQRVMYYTSGCEKKTYKGKTCRRTVHGYSKSRDHKRTFRVTRKSLL